MPPFRKSTRIEFPVELDEFDKRILHHVIDKRLSMASRERLFATLMSCRYVCDADIGGTFVECGVWRGGNAIIAADVFGRHNKGERVLLFDTFEGFTAPTDYDFDNRRHKPARDQWERELRTRHNKWASVWERVLRPRKRPQATLDDVKRHFREAGIPADRWEFVKGDVLETLNVEANLPQRISVLRLDTDWYESTKKELEVLWPCLSQGGILIVDDYGHWAGAKKAVDDYFNGRRPFFHYIDHTGRLIVKA